MKLKAKITTFVIGILLLTIGSISALSFKQMRTTLKDQLGQNLLDVAHSVSMNYLVLSSLEGKSQAEVKILDDQISSIQKKTDVEFIVIMDMKGIRYTHPIKEKIGKRFEGGDEVRVLTRGEEYVSESSGILGPSLRAFVPIYIDGKQIGAVCVGSPLVKVYSDIYSKIDQFIPFVIVGLILGTIAATMLSSNIKKAIFNLEPEEIALILKEKETVIESVKEGILAVDRKGRITLFNKEAQRMLGLTKNHLGKQFTDYTYESKISEVLKVGEFLENIEVKIRPDLTILCKYNPLKNDKNEVIGIVINFRDMTEIKKMAEELTGIKKMTWSLRAQNHEFMNKLHIISGMIQLGEYDEAIQFISNTTRKRNELSSILTEKIKNVTLAALLFAKYNKAEEARITLDIDENCKLNKLPDYMSDEELSSVIGNIIENSFDAVNNDGTGIVKFKICEEDDTLYIQVRDNGPGISEEIKDKIYEIGTTSKPGQRGVGMYIVKKIIDEAQGTIDFELDNGTVWNINIPMKRS